MIPKRVVLENFLSFGAPVEFQFDDGEPLWVLCGPNGVGKSSVFDAITYALFGCHRGGKGQGMDRLIRHGTNGFRVEFEFGFAGREYKIIRNYGKKSVERVWIDGGEIDLPTGKNKVRDWAQRELGLTYEQFTASVLLKQGEADKIITGTGKERLEMLKTIIGVEKFEALADRAKVAARQAKEKQARLAEQLAALPPVTEEELESAKSERDTAEASHQRSQEAEAAAGTCVEQARQFEKLERSRLEFEGLVAAAEERRERVADILAKHAKLAELGTVVPTLRSVVTAREDLAKLEPQLAEQRERENQFNESVETATAARDGAKALAEQHAGEATALGVSLTDQKRILKSHRDLLPIAEDVEEIERSLAAIPVDIEERILAAESGAEVAERERDRTANDRSTAAALLKRREEELAEFDTVEVGAKCSRCGQKVDAAHAAAERQRLQADILNLREQARETADAAKSAKDRLAETKIERDRWTKRRIEREKWNEKRIGLTRHGDVPSVASLRDWILAAESKVSELQASKLIEEQKAGTQKLAANTFESNRKTADEELKKCRESLRVQGQKSIETSAHLQAWIATLPANWAMRSATLRTDELSILVHELDSLKKSDVAEQHRKLQEDAARRGEWDRQLANVRPELDAIPMSSRIPAQQAEQFLLTSRAATKSAADARGAAERQLESFQKQAEQRAKLVADERAAETAARIAAKLHEKLGPEGLLRDLVRSAEKQIVKFANETVANLSEGDLAIELDDAEDGPDKAFTLKVRRTDSEPIGVQYLSGSQKFRVAVAVALAIGRFATSGTQSKPLECVIIDEGFGSLDKDGLRCMAEELTRLKDKAALKRIVLVSHQEEFVKSFPVGWQLAKGENGTTARPIRQRA